MLLAEHGLDQSGVSRTHVIFCMPARMLMRAIGYWNSCTQAQILFSFRECDPLILLWGEQKFMLGLGWRLFYRGRVWVWGDVQIRTSQRPS